MNTENISRLNKKNIIASGSWGENLGTRKDRRHSNGYYRAGKRKPKYKRIWNRKYRHRDLDKSYDVFNKYTNYWEYD